MARTYQTRRRHARKQYANAETIRCSYCGALLRRGVAVCPKCGQSVFGDPRRSRNDQRTADLMRLFIYFWLLILAPLPLMIQEFFTYAPLIDIYCGVVILISVGFLWSQLKVMHQLVLTKFQVLGMIIRRLAVPLYALVMALLGIAGAK